MAKISEEREVRVEKLKQIRSQNINPYLDRCTRTHTLAEASNLKVGTKNIEICGRLMLKRVFGKLIFSTLQDFSGKFQIALDVNTISQDNFKFFQKIVDVGDFIYAKGEIFKTQKGELTLLIKEYKLLSKSIRPLPEKFHGIIDLESRSRQRYLDLIMNKETKDRFIKRIKIIKVIRDFLDKNNFIEIETPILQAKPSGAMAKPFKTHHNALDIDLYLRIAPETYLKRCIAGGFEKVYEFARCFRNEGMDPSHIQEFTMLEFYSAYWNYLDNIDFTEKLIKHVLQQINGSLEIMYQGKKIDFSENWPRYSFRDLIKKHADIDIDLSPDKDDLIKAIKDKNIVLEEVDFKKVSRGNLVDQLYKKVARPKMITPQFLLHHPIDLSPLARKNDDNQLITDRFQLVVNSWEIVNAYSELVDPIDQRERLLEQARARDKGDDEAMIMEEDFIECMEYGMPPISGWGMGIDRFVALLTNQENVREIILFPLMRPIDSSIIKGAVMDNKENSNINNEQMDSDQKIIKPEDIKDLGVKKEDLKKIFNEKIKSENLKYHCLASAAVLRGVAKKFNLNEDNYYYLGLVHDIDFDEEKDMNKHGRTGADWLKKMGMLEYPLHAILSHNEEGTGVKMKSFADFALSCSESITGLISATAKIYPDKKVTSVKVKSITKRMKEKAFAANVSRDRIRYCEKIGLTLEEFVDIALKSMCEISDQIGL